MKILFFGDIVGRIGVKAVSSLLPILRRKYSPDLVIANGENVSNGKGITEIDLNTLLDMGIDVVTLGNHWHNKRQIDDYIDDYDQLIRPANLLHYDRGVGSAVFDIDGVEVRITNILGQAFMQEEVKAPYQAINEILNEDPTPIHIIDFHGESTSEKQSFAHVLDGRVSAVLGTHTHVQTNDARILKGGTALMCDVGMCGSYDSIIGWEVNSVTDKVIYGKQTTFRLEDEAEAVVCGVYLDIDDVDGKTIDIEPFSLREAA